MSMGLGWLAVVCSNCGECFDPAMVVDGEPCPKLSCGGTLEDEPRSAQPEQDTRQDDGAA